MYIPSSFQVTETPQLHQFIEQFSFGTLVSQSENGLEATHLPFVLNRNHGPLGCLSGHLARANLQWQRAGHQQVLAVFQGPHAYISPRWMDAENVVPTWNYVAVHVTGPLRLVEDRSKLQDLLRTMVSLYEPPEGWTLNGPTPEYFDRLLEGIVGFEIPIEQLEGKWKLSQNHPVPRREGIIEGLRKTGRSLDGQIADLMAATLPAATS